MAGMQAVTRWLIGESRDVLGGREPSSARA